MNDFLKKLKNTQQKDGVTGSVEGDQDKDSLMLKPEDMDDLLKNLDNILPVLTENCSSFISSIDQYIEANDHVARTRIKMNEAITVFFSNLNLLLFGNNPPVLSDTSLSRHAPAGYAVGGRYTKGEIIAMIKSMRKEGATFSVIAEYLKDKGIPTFSGRGDWHAQTIHRLCK